MSDYVVDEEELVNSIYDVSYPKWIYDELPKLEFEFLKQIWEYALFKYFYVPEHIRIDNNYI